MPEYIYAFIGVIIGAIISCITLLVNNKFNYNQLFAEKVSSNRMDWINFWRKNIAQIIVIKELLIELDKSSKKYFDLKKEMLTSKEGIILRLNLSEEKHRRMNLLLEEFVMIDNKNNFICKKIELEKLTRDILKPEWERFKIEAKGRKK